MIGISAIGSYTPAQVELNLDKMGDFGVDQRFIEDKIGVVQRAQKLPEEETSGMCVKAFGALREQVDIGAEELDCIVVCTQNPDGSGLPHTSAIVHSLLGCRQDVAAFDISLGCSGYVYSLWIMASFMQAQGLKKGVLFTADPYSKIVDPDDKNTALLFGDAATATLLGEDFVYRLDAAEFGTIGSMNEALRCEDGKLHMNGRLVFNFAMTTVPPQIAALLKKTGDNIQDIDLILLHQGSKYILDQLTKRLGVDANKVPCDLKDSGNTVSSSIPLLLKRYLNNNSCQKVVLCGFGVGLSVASGLISRE